MISGEGARQHTIDGRTRKFEQSEKTVSALSSPRKAGRKSFSFLSGLQAQASDTPKGRMAPADCHPPRQNVVVLTIVRYYKQHESRMHSKETMR